MAVQGDSLYSETILVAEVLCVGPVHKAHWCSRLLLAKAKLLMSICLFPAQFPSFLTEFLNASFVS